MQGSARACTGVHGACTGLALACTGMHGHAGTSTGRAGLPTPRPLFYPPKGAFIVSEEGREVFRWSWSGPGEWCPRGPRPDFFLFANHAMTTTPLIINLPQPMGRASTDCCAQEAQPSRAGITTTGNVAG